jgi:hypothetical protein
MVSSISNPIEREVASVLQAELSRYDKRSRSVGGLGSIHLVVNGHEMTGVGNDSWNPNSPKNQSISDNLNAAELRSDNLDALLGFYGRLTTVEEKASICFGAARPDGWKSIPPYHIFQYLCALENWTAAGDVSSPRFTICPSPPR